MLAAVTEVLRERNLLDPGDEPGYNITLVTGNFVNIDAFTRSGAFFHIRVKQCGSLPAEYENYCNARQSFPRHVSEPLGRCVKGDWEIFVVRGIRHRPVSAGSIARGKHGDFVVNNLGLSDSGLAVFDWEDFGRTAFPGLDLCTLLASDAVFNVDVLRAIIIGAKYGRNPYEELLDGGCPVIELTPDLFRRLIPLYLVIFLDLKRNYGKTIGQLVSKVILELHRSVGADLGMDCE